MLVYLCIYSYKLITHMLIHPPTHSATSSAQLWATPHCSHSHCRRLGIILLSEFTKVFGINGSILYILPTMAPTTCQWKRKPRFPVVRMVKIAEVYTKLELLLLTMVLLALLSSRETAVIVNGLRGSPKFLLSRTDCLLIFVIGWLNSLIIKIGSYILLKSVS